MDFVIFKILPIWLAVYALFKTLGILVTVVTFIIVTIIATACVWIEMKRP